MVLCKHYFPYLVQVKNLTLENFQLCLLVFFFDKTSFSETNEHFFQKFESSLELHRAKRKFSDNPGRNILELYNILVKVRFTTIKTKLYIQYSKLEYELPHELPNDLRLKILGNQEYYSLFCCKYFVRNCSFNFLQLYSQLYLSDQKFIQSTSFSYGTFSLQNIKSFY